MRKLKLNKTHQVLISDTVGFIRKLPHNLVASFRSTLKELLEANLILIVLDASSRLIDEHLNTIKMVLSDLGANNITKSIVMNKLDQVNQEQNLKRLKAKFSDAIFISALHHLKLDDIKLHIIDKIESDFEIFDIAIPYNKGKTISQLQTKVEIIESLYGDEEIFLKVKGKKEIVEKIIG